VSWARLTAFIAASGALHASLGMVEESPSRSRALGPRHEPIHVEFSVVEGVQLTPELPSEPPPPSKPKPKPKMREVSPPPTIAPSVVTREPTPPVPATPARVAPSPRPRLVDLSPLAAARGLVDVRGAPQQPHAAGLPHETKLAGIPLATYLKSELAMPSLTSRPDDPVLRPRKGGGYSFDGNGFDATIERDGSVRFDDKYGSFSVIPTRHGGENVLWLLNFSFDLTGLMEHVMGNDPYRSERRWFLERTTELRDRLAHEAFARLDQRARVKLRHALQDLWNDANLTLEQKKRETFEHWDMNADDEIGARGRQVVVDFVRERCPVGSECEFRAEECSRFNQARRSHEPFQPYQ
jgi:hypothetical protein